MARTRVYVADHGFVKVTEGINIWQTGVVLEDHPAAVRYTERLREAGTVDAEGARQIRLYGQTATLKSVGHLIQPPGAIDTVEQRLVDEADALLIADLKKPTDRGRAERLDVDERTIRNWRAQGLIRK